MRCHAMPEVGRSGGNNQVSIPSSEMSSTNPSGSLKFGSSSTVAVRPVFSRWLEIFIFHDILFR